MPTFDSHPTKWYPPPPPPLHRMIGLRGAYHILQPLTFRTRHHAISPRVHVCHESHSGVRTAPARRCRAYSSKEKTCEVMSVRVRVVYTTTLKPSFFFFFQAALVVVVSAWAPVTHSSLSHAYEQRRRDVGIGGGGGGGREGAVRRTGFMTTDLYHIHNARRCGSV